MKFLLFRNITKKFFRFVQPKDTFEDILPGNRTQLWNEYMIPDYKYILRHSKEIKIMNIDMVRNLTHVKYFTLPTNPEVNVYVPYKNNVIGMRKGTDMVAFPYAIVSERSGDCRLFIFESIQCLIEWLSDIKTYSDLDLLNKQYLNRIRIIRQYSLFGETFKKDNTFLDVECDTSKWPDTKSKLSDELKAHPNYVKFNPDKHIKNIVLDSNNNFIKEWRIK